MIQLYIYMYTIFFRFFFHIDYYRILSRIPGSIQYVMLVFITPVKSNHPLTAVGISKNLTLIVWEQPMCSATALRINSGNPSKSRVSSYRFLLIKLIPVVGKLVDIQHIQKFLFTVSLLCTNEFYDFYF